MFKKILVCLDGSKLAEQVLPYATEQALCCRSKVVLLQIIVVQPPTVVVAGASAYAVKAAEEQTDRDEAEAKVYLESLAQPLRQAGLNVECVILRGPQAGGAIVEYADGQEVSLIAIATHGRSGIGRLVFGSVTDFVLGKSGLPILLIKPKLASS